MTDETPASAGHNRRARLRGRRVDRWGSCGVVWHSDSTDAEGGKRDGLTFGQTCHVARFGRPIISEAETFDCDDSSCAIRRVPRS
jgi:hypothetical protein